jgi:hypothetical protein
MLESLDERFDLRARGVEQEAALALCACFQHSGAIAARVVRDHVDRIWRLRGRC